MSKRPSFIVRKRCKDTAAKRNPFRSRGYLKFGKWETVKACETITEAAQLLIQTAAEFKPTTRGHTLQLLLSHHGRQLNSKFDNTQLTDKGLAIAFNESLDTDGAVS